MGHLHFTDDKTKLLGEVTDLPKVPQWKSVDLNWVSRWVRPKLGEG